MMKYFTYLIDHLKYLFLLTELVIIKIANRQTFEMHTMIVSYKS